ncbi:MAG: DUF3536 domain-containing protein [Gemmatimonadaceae bacterium]
MKKPESTPARSLVVHAHLYQPPREHPFFDEIETEVSAAPYHDWNQRIERECYRAVVAARVTGDTGHIARIVNTLEYISFNVGPTLFSWLERQAPDTYRAILTADRASCERLGGLGNAIAHPYHHVILPLASRRDKVTGVRWGIADFRRRFGREPLGFWLPETAVDDETLDVLAQEGMRFTVLAPYQVRHLPPNGLPGRYTTSNGRHIAVCPYHGDISHGIAFGGLVRDGSRWARTILEVPPTDPEGSVQLVSAATDGETYGHHHRFAEMALARVIEICTATGVTVENYASFLDRHPASHAVELVAPSAWSCAHGVERWRSNCGCRSDGQMNPSQEWRTPLRDGLNVLANELHVIFQRDGAALFGDVWEARDRYGAAVARDADARYEAATAWLPADAPIEQRRRAAELLEMERDALRMFTSCAWFFDDIGGIEPMQVLRYAVRAIELSGDSERLMATLRTALRQAKSNSPAVGTGEDVVLRLASPPHAAARTAAAAAALVALGEEPNALLSANAVFATIRDDVVTVTSRDTRGERHFRVAVVERRANDIVCDVTALEGEHAGGWRIPLAEFPERPRLAIRQALLRALLPRCLTPHEMDRLALGEHLRAVIVVPLLRAVARLDADQSAEALDVAHALLDLFEQLETNVPFDLQTEFWTVWQRAAPERRASLEALRLRLGFEP